jgi:hypothetical protein
VTENTAVPVFKNLVSNYVLILNANSCHAQQIYVAHFVITDMLNILFFASISGKINANLDILLHSIYAHEKHVPLQLSSLLYTNM